MENKKILIVDDNLDNLTITSKILKKEGFEVTTVSSGFECLKILKEFKPDLILLDILLPDIDGYEVCRIIKSNTENQDVIVIYLTAINRSSEVKAEGYRQGADGYITRPISNYELISVINTYFKILDKSKNLRKSEERFNLLSDLSFEGLLIHDKKSIIDVNKTLLNIMGYNSVEELPQFKSILEFVAPDSKAFVKEKLEQDYVGTYVANLIRKDRSIFPAEINVKNITINGLPARAVSIRDITERFILEREVKSALKKALEASRLKSEFVANVSHEIRTPISSILTVNDLLRDTPLTEEQLKYIEMSQRSAETLLSIVNDILDISKIEAGKIDIEEIDFDLYALLDFINELFEHKTKIKGLEFEIIREEDIPQYLKGDPLRLKQILTNLLTNSVKFTQQGSISLSVTPQRRVSEEKILLLFVVTDTGPGISQEKQEAIFDSFVQEDGSISRKFGGTGLGLTISKNLVQLMGGNIWVESELGEGSSFYCTLPFTISKGTKKEEDFYDIDDVIKDLANTKILLAEDNDINQFLIKKMLEKKGFNVEIAHNGVEVLQTLSKGDDFDIIFMDIQMPEMDGIEVTKIIRGKKEDPRWEIKKRDIPIIALTANAMKEDREICISAGMDEYISKPIDFKILINILNKLLKKGGKKNLIDEKRQQENKAPLINKQKALELLGGDEEMLDQIFDMFVNYVPSQIETLNKAIIDQDMEVLGRVSHSLKSNSGTIGCDEMRQRAYAMEMSAKNNDLEGFKRNYEVFISLVDMVIKEIGSMKTNLN